MKKYLKLLTSGLKYAGYLTLGTTTIAFGYLQYINSQIGPIEIDRQLSTKYYVKQLKMDPKEADRMYYWLLYDIALMRILTYSSYSSYCRRLNQKVIAPIITNYEQVGILDRINNTKEPSSKAAKTLYKDISSIRKKNFEGLTTYEFIVKQLRKQQKLMDTRKIVGLEKQTLQKIDRIQKFICETGMALKDGEVQAYVSHLPEMEARLPGDILHKILFI